MKNYEQKIIRAFQDLCKRNRNGASPAEVTNLLAEREELSEYDTVIDIEKLMHKLRERGLL